MKIRNIFILIIVLIVTQTQAQKIKIAVADVQLNVLLLQLRDKYGVNISFNNESLSNYKVSINKNFDNVENAIKYILKPLPFTYSLNNHTYVIYPESPKQILIKKRSFILSGKIIDNQTSETLPFTNILVNNTGTSSNQNGAFSFVSNCDSVFRLKISHLGYYILDTTINTGISHILKLKSSVNQLKEIVVSDMVLETFLNFSGESGVMKLNHKVSKFLPGNTDNSIFTTLNLQPGITATNEQAQQFSILGSFEGQSRLYVDDFLVFGLKNFNVNISSINPYIIKDIEVFKAGYNAKYGECVGGIVYVTTNDGNPSKYKNTFSVSNYTLNNYIQIPVNKNNIISLAVRTTYKDLYQTKVVNNNQKSIKSKYSDITIVPDYSFKDINLKYIHTFNQSSSLKISSLVGTDKFNYNIDDRINNRLIYKNTSENNFQQAASLKYFKSFGSGITTNISIATSSIDNNYSNIYTVKSWLGRLLRNKNALFDNTVYERTLKNEYTIPINSSNSLNIGILMVKNKVLWKEDSLGVNVINSSNSKTHLTTFIMDNFHLNKFNATYGFRLTRMIGIKKYFLEPRLSLNYKFNSSTSINGAIGIYNQYLTKSSFTDSATSTTRYIWTIANNQQYPIQSGIHLITGLNKTFSNTQFNLDLYYKKIYGITQFVKFPGKNIEELIKGNSRHYGINAYIKQNFKGQTIWLSYTISKNQERFPDLFHNAYVNSSNDQLHELKIAAIFNYKNFYLSSDYIYGSGFPVVDYNSSRVSRIPYNRFDISLNYKYNFSKITSELGISIINLFNTSNYLYTNFERVPSDQLNTINIYKESMPFTPSLYFKLVF